MRNIISLTLKAIAVILCIVCGLYGLFLTFQIVVVKLGIIGGVIAITFFAPATIIFIPWYEALANSNWYMIILVYGGAVGGTIIFMLGMLIKKEID